MQEKPLPKQIVDEIVEILKQDFDTQDVNVGVKEYGLTKFVVKSDFLNDLCIKIENINKMFGEDCSILVYNKMKEYNETSVLRIIGHYDHFPVILDCLQR